MAKHPDFNIICDKLLLSYRFVGTFESGDPSDCCFYKRYFCWITHLTCITWNTLLLLSQLILLSIGLLKMVWSSIPKNFCSWRCPLTHCGLVVPYGNIDIGQNWLIYWLVALRHQANTWTNVDWSSVKSSDIHIRAISQGMPQPLITKICLKITCLKFQSNFPGANELTTLIRTAQN